MEFSEVYVQLAIFCGSIFLAFSAFLAHKTDRYIPKPISRKWRIMEYMILFFLVGYLLFLFFIIRKVAFPTDLITSTIFLGGALFVLLVINVTRVAIRGIKLRQRQIVAMHRDLHEAYESTIEGWGRALEQRDKETKGHTTRVTHMTITMARLYPFSKEEIDNIRRGSLLHDIGKMSIPDAILLKEGPLTEKERNEMERHPVYAKEMLSSIEYLKPALDIPYCHHEHWDGSGYPQGLKGDDIPLAARIFAVADVWDALISERRYHDPWSTEKVCDHIKARAGSHFDPEVVEKFLTLHLCDPPAAVFAGDAQTKQA